MVDDFFGMNPPLAPTDPAALTPLDEPARRQQAYRDRRSGFFVS
jgi:hypothetical protein